MLAITGLHPTPIVRFRGEDPTPHGPVSKHVPLLVGTVDELPGDLDGMVCASDLQAREPRGTGGTGGRLLGDWIAPRVASAVRTELEITPGRCAAILAGDLYAHPVDRNKRGGYGAVRGVWSAFAEHFGWVIGVPGNHDLFGEPEELPSDWPERIRVLHGERTTLAGLSVGGVGGCVGKTQRPFRYSYEEQADRLLRLLEDPLELLVLHQGPPGDGRARPGAEQVGELLAEARVQLCICGHEHWASRHHVCGGTDVVNTHETIVVLRGAR